jgi:hypothetical protein
VTASELGGESRTTKGDGARLFALFGGSMLAPRGLVASSFTFDAMMQNLPLVTLPASRNVRDLLRQQVHELSGAGCALHMRVKRADGH